MNGLIIGTYRQNWALLSYVVDGGTDLLCWDLYKITVNFRGAPPITPKNLLKKNYGPRLWKDHEEAESGGAYTEMNQSTWLFRQILAVNRWWTFYDLNNLKRFYLYNKFKHNKGFQFVMILDQNLKYRKSILLLPISKISNGLRSYYPQYTLALINKKKKVQKIHQGSN